MRFKSMFLMLFTKMCGRIILIYFLKD